MNKEQELIELIQQITQSKYIGDDCAYLEDLNLLISTDTMVEDIHFTRDMPPGDLGWKAAAINFSDIAAMGGVPLYFSLSASLTSDITNEWLESFTIGLNQCLREYAVELIGGDITGGENLSFTGNIIGAPHTPGIIASRNTAKAGENIIISGPTGLNAASDYRLRPIPQVELGQRLIQSGCKCLIDLSDGLLDGLIRIAKTSNVSLEIDLDRMPLISDAITLEHILTGGEDYQLLGTMQGDPPEGIHTIGQTSIQSVEPVVIQHKGLKLDLSQYKIYNHFAD